MKALIITLGMMFLSVTANAATLLTAHKSPGFEINPTEATLTVDDSGAVILETLELRTGIKKVELIAAFSPRVISEISREISSIDAAELLIDENEGEPMCTDIPGYSVEAMISGQSKTIYHAHSCHTFTL